MLLSQTQKKRENKTKKKTSNLPSHSQTRLNFWGLCRWEDSIWQASRKTEGRSRTWPPAADRSLSPSHKKWNKHGEELGQRVWGGFIIPGYFVIHSMTIISEGGCWMCIFFFFIIMRFPTPWKWQGFSNNNRKILQLLLKRHCGMAWLSLWDKMLKDYFSLSSALVIDWNFLWMSVARGGDRNAGSNKTGASSL